MSVTDALSDSQFAAVEEAMALTELGRGFLDEYARRSSVVRAADVMDALGQIRRSLQARCRSTHVEILRRELQEMSASIMQTRHEIAAIKPENAGDNRIMAATGELDVIVTATERATTEILASAEQVLDIVMKARAEGATEASFEEIETQVTHIFTACSFQDITGQRITKVVNVLRYLEQRVNAMIDIWGIDGVEPSEATDESREAQPDAELLQGPQIEGEGASQDEIDRILRQALADHGGAGDAPAEPEFTGTAADA